MTKRFGVGISSGTGGMVREPPPGGRVCVYARDVVWCRRGVAVCPAVPPLPSCLGNPEHRPR